MAIELTQASSYLLSGIRNSLGLASGYVGNVKSMQPTFGGNNSTGQYSIVGNGQNNNASGDYSVVAAGTNNNATGNYSSIVNGDSNNAIGQYSVIAGGNSNTANAQYSFIGGGVGNSTNQQTNTFILGSNIFATQPDTTWVNNLVATTSISGVYYGDGSNLRNTAIGQLVNYLPLSGGNMTGTLYGQNVYGNFYGDATHLTNIVNSISGTYNQINVTYTGNSATLGLYNNVTIPGVMTATSYQGNGSTLSFFDGINLQGASITNGNGSGLTGIISQILPTANQINVSTNGTVATLSLPSDVSLNNINVAGNLTVSGSATYISSQSLVVNDPLIYIGGGNLANVNDLGLVGHFTAGTILTSTPTYQHTGLVRRNGQSSPGYWTLFSGVTSEPLSSATVGGLYNDATFTTDSLAVYDLSASHSTFALSSIFVGTSTPVSLIRGIGSHVAPIDTHRGSISVQPQTANQARYHLYNNAGVSEWVFGQTSGLDHNFTIASLYNTTETPTITILPTGTVGIGTTSPLSSVKLDVAGTVRATTLSGYLDYNYIVNTPFGIAKAPTKPALTSNAYTVLSSDTSLMFNNGSTTVTVTLLTPSSFIGKWLYIKNSSACAVVSNASNVVPLAGDSDTSPGTAILAAGPGKYAALQSDGNKWIIMMAN